MGIVMNGVINEPQEEFSFMLMMFWPLVLIMLAICIVIQLLLELGKKIGKKIN